MITIYKPNGEDWLGFKVSRDNPYTYHHIKKKCEGGLRTLDNGAILTKRGQQYIHGFEQTNPETFVILNSQLLRLNRLDRGLEYTEQQEIEFVKTMTRKKVRR